MLFARRNESQLSAAKVPPLEVEDEVQHRLEGVFASVAERYASDIADVQEHQGGCLHRLPGSSLFAAAEEETPSVEQAQQEMTFLKVTSAFVAATRCRVLDVDHAKEPLAHFGRFGPAYDAVCKMLVDVLRDDGMFNGEATTVQHVCGTALQSVRGGYLCRLTLVFRPLSRDGRRGAYGQHRAQQAHLDGFHSVRHSILYHQADSPIRRRRSAHVCYRLCYEEARQHRQSRKVGQDETGEREKSGQARSDADVLQTTGQSACPCDSTRRRTLAEASRGQDRGDWRKTRHEQDLGRLQAV